MDLKRLAPLLSVGVGTIAVILLLGLLSHPDAVASAGLTLSQPSAKEGTASSLIGAAAVHYVTITGTDSGDCSTPAGACRTIQYAVDVAGDGDLIKIATGVYTDVHSRDTITQVVYISKSLSLDGGYTPRFDTGPDPIARPTTLDAQGHGRVVYIQGDITVTLTGLRITGGNAARSSEQSSTGWGGGVNAMGATVTVSASQVYSNSGSRDADGGGGGLRFVRSNVTLVANIIQGNTGGLLSVGVGGGLEIVNSEFNVVGNQILSNTAVISKGMGFGGGVAIGDSSGQLVDNLIDGNVTAGEQSGLGGGVYLETARDDLVTLRGNVVQNNVAVLGNGGGTGGGIAIFTPYRDASLDVRISDNVFQGNRAGVSDMGVGGGLFAWADNGTTMTLTFVGNLVLSNTATSSGSYGGVGGGLVIDNVSADFADNRFIGNTAGNGSGIYFARSHLEQRADILKGNVTRGFFESIYEDPGSSVVFEDSDATVSNLVVIDNRATSTGTAILVRSSNVRLVHPTLARNRGSSGIYVDQRARSRVALTNAILVSHTVGITVAAGNTATLDTVLWYSNTVNVGGEGHIAVTAAHTGHPAFDADGYHLTAASAAIDRGVFAGVGTDIDGDTRPDGCFPDLGADEFIPGADCTRIYLPIVVRQSP